MFRDSKYFSIHNGQFTSIINNITKQPDVTVTPSTVHPPPGGLETVALHTVSAAFHNSSERFDPPKCHPETRLAVLDRIQAWASSSCANLEMPVMWLTGPAGAGKSAIAQTLSELWHQSGSLAAVFFFSRTGARRNVKTYLISTIVYQLLQSLPYLRGPILDAMRKDPMIFERSLSHQVEQLIVGPLVNYYTYEVAFPQPKVIVIDGLDECSGESAQREILQAFSHAFRRPYLPLPLILLIASRPEQQIRDTFNRTELRRIASRISLDDRYNPRADIELLLRCKFEEIKLYHPANAFLSPNWPSETDLQKLVDKSSGQFIYPSVVMKYINSPRHDPQKCLQVVIDLAIPEGDQPFAELDALYNLILSSVAPSSSQAVTDVLRALVFCQDPNSIFERIQGNSPRFLEMLFFLEPGQSYINLIDLYSILDIPPAAEAEKVAIRFIHASFSDYLIDKSRAGKFYLHEGRAFERLSLYLFRHLVLNLANLDQVPTQARHQWIIRVDLQLSFSQHLRKALPTYELEAVLKSIIKFSPHSVAFGKNLGISITCEARLLEISNKLELVPILQYLWMCNKHLETSRVRRWLRKLYLRTVWTFRT